jgi:hypothetical protein
VRENVLNEVFIRQPYVSRNEHENVTRHGSQDLVDCRGFPVPMLLNNETNSLVARRSFANLRDGVVRASTCDNYYLRRSSARLEHLTLQVRDQMTDVVTIVVAGHSDSNLAFLTRRAQCLSLPIFAMST